MAYRTTGSGINAIALGFLAGGLFAAACTALAGAAGMAAGVSGMPLKTVFGFFLAVGVPCGIVYFLQSETSRGAAAYGIGALLLLTMTAGLSVLTYAVFRDVMLYVGLNALAIGGLSAALFLKSVR